MDTPDDLVEMLLELGGGAAAVDVEVEHRLRGTLLLAFDRSRATIGLDSDGIFQCAREVAPLGHSTLSVGGQDTQLDLRYVVDIDTAADVAKAWLTGEELPAAAGWERQ